MCPSATLLHYAMPCWIHADHFHCITAWWSTGVFTRLQDCLSIQEINLYVSQMGQWLPERALNSILTVDGHQMKCALWCRSNRFNRCKLASFILMYGNESQGVAYGQPKCCCKGKTLAISLTGTVDEQSHCIGMPALYNEVGKEHCLTLHSLASRDPSWFITQTHCLILSNLRPLHTYIPIWSAKIRSVYFIIYIWNNIALNPLFLDTFAAVFRFQLQASTNISNEDSYSCVKHKIWRSATACISNVPKSDTTWWPYSSLWGYRVAD